MAEAWRGGGQVWISFAEHILSDYSLWPIDIWPIDINRGAPPNPVLVFSQEMSSSSPYCPFCSIAKENTPFSPFSPPLVRQDDTSIEVHTNPILSTENVLAFLDIMPLTRGHVLLIPRRHHTKMSDLPVREAMEVGM